MLFDRDFIRTLEYLYFVARRVRSGADRGEHAGHRRGESVEFADYRPYASGDEIRRVDWNVYARHDQLFIREFNATETLHLCLYLDSSASMEVGRPGKFDTARRLCAALAYIGLVNFDTTSVHHFRDERIPLRQFMKGRSMIFDLLDDLGRLRPEGRTHMGRAFPPEGPRLKGSSVAVILSDFYDFDTAQETLSRMKNRFDRIHVVRVEAREEQDPALGRFQMTDPETGRILDLSVNRQTAERYRQAVQKYSRDFEEFCKKTELYGTSGFNDDPLEDWVVRLVQSGAIMNRR